MNVEQQKAYGSAREMLGIPDVFSRRHLRSAAPRTRYFTGIKVIRDALDLYFGI
jgi:hypothetical protein